MSGLDDLIGSLTKSGGAPGPVASATCSAASSAVPADPAPAGAASTTSSAACSAEEARGRTQPA